MNAVTERLHQIDQGEPIVIREGALNWPALQKWTPEYLRLVLGDHRVLATASRTGVIRFKPDKSHENPSEQSYIPNARFSDMASAIINEREIMKYYIQQIDLRSEFPSMLADLDLSSAGPQDVINIWFGSAGVCTQLHFDLAPNVFAQIYGRKRFLLYPPEMTEFLYKYPDDCKMPHVSQLDLRNLDLSKFPKAANAFPWRFVLEPGDLLLIPSRWWHFVVSETVSISVNRWLGA